MHNRVYLVRFAYLIEHVSVMQYDSFLIAVEPGLNALEFIDHMQRELGSYIQQSNIPAARYWFEQITEVYDDLPPQSLTA